MCEWCEDRDTSLTGHSNGGVDTPRQADVYQGQQVGQQHGEHALLHGHLFIIIIFYYLLFFTSGSRPYLVDKTDIGQTVHQDGEYLKQEVVECL